MSIFNSRQKIKVRFSTHNLSHSYGGSFKTGIIYPILCTKVVPGDTFQIVSTPDLRTQPLISPFFTNVRCDVRYFYCRNLLLWKNFDNYITNHDRYFQGQDPLFVPPVHPTIKKFSGSVGSFFDHLYGALDSDTIYSGLDALPARMYNMVYNEYYRDENLCEPAVVDLSDGSENAAHFSLRKGCYKKDYFTSSLPFSQAGDDVFLPSNVVLNGHTPYQQHLVDNRGRVPAFEGAVPATAAYLHGRRISVEDENWVPGLQNPLDESDWIFTNIDPNGSLSTEIDIRDFRRANAVQTFLERSAINGNRYAEYMLAHFGVHTADNSAFRPQYLGGGETLVNVKPVESTVGTESAPQATQAGRGRLTGMVGMNKRFFFTEYGWIMACMVIRPDAQYVGGINKQFFADGDRFENYYNPAFQNVGMDEVKVRELAYPTYDDRVGAPAFDPTDVLSYQERGFEYKTIPNTVHGQMATTQKYWNAIRDFSGLSSKPALNQAFVEVDDSALDDVAAVTDYDLFVGEIYHGILANRPMQYRAKYRV